jgi:hypothetical protein
MRKILVSAISFVNKEKPGSEIYTTFAKRLINDVLTKTPYDVLITTNYYNDFEEPIRLHPDRVIVRDEKLENHKTHVGAFNQLLKFYAIKDIDKKYDWVLYLDCDAGFTTNIDIYVLEKQMDDWESQGYDMLALRINATYNESEQEYLSSLTNGKKHLFDDKFKFYGVNPEWRGACLPSEHILLLKNNNKLEVMSKEFEKFCTKFETQDNNNVITYDMEAFEIGVSAFIAGYNVGDMNWGKQCEILKVGFNFNNWEKIKR